MTKASDQIRTAAVRAVFVTETLLGICAAVVLASMLVIVLVTAGLRYFFHAGIVGVEDLGIWLHIALIALAAPLSLNSALAMRFDVLVRILPETGRKMAGIVSDTITVMAALVCLFGASRITTMLGGYSPTLGLPEWIRFGFIGVGGALMLVLLLLRFAAQGRWRDGTVVLTFALVFYHVVPFVFIDTSLPASFYLAVFAGIGLLVAAPLAHAFLVAAYLAISFGSTLPEQAIVSTTVTGMSKFLLLAIPFFLLTGGLLGISGAAQKLVRAAETLVGHKRAGLAQTVLLTSVMFSGASGSSVANAAFGAATFQPELVRNGYPPPQAGAIIAATSVLDNVIPPSIAFLILAAATNLSIGSLLVGGFFAGGIMACCLAIAIHFTVKEQHRRQPAPAKERWQAAFAAIPAFSLGVIVVAGIRFGIVTTTEASALAAAYTFSLTFFARTGGKALFSTFRQAATEAAAIGLLIGTAAPFAFLLATDGIAGHVSDFVAAIGGSAFAVLLLANLILLVAGLVLDIGAAILLLGPILLPAAIAAGIDPVHFGVILVVNLMIHGLTPPIGMLVFVVSGVTKVPASSLFRAVLPYLAALLVSLVILCAYALIFR
jgi:tripartite ATP-independent transporter DctM subunit